MKWSADGLRLWRRIQTATLDVSLIPLITANIGCVALATTIWYYTKLHKLHGCMSSYCNSSLFMMKLRTKIVAKFGIENQRLETKGKKKNEKNLITNKKSLNDSKPRDIRRRYENWFAVECCLFLLLSCSRGLHRFYFTRLLRGFHVILRRFTAIVGVTPIQTTQISVPL